MELKLSHKDYIWSYIGTIVSLGSNVVILPFALYFLTEEMYGLWGIFQSLASITILFDFGFSVTFARNINYCWCGATELKKQGCTYAECGEPNFLLMRRVMHTCQFVFLILSLAAVFLITIPGTFYIKYICRSLYGENYLLAWWLYAAAIFLNLYYCYYNAFLRGVGAILEANRVAVTAKVVQILLTILLLMKGFGIVGTGISFLAYGVIYRFLSKWEFERFHHIGRQLKKVQGFSSITDIKEIFEVIWYNASREGVVTISAYLSSQACTVIGGFFLPLNIMGTYSLANQLVTALANISLTLYTANQPVLQAAFVVQDKNRIQRTMSIIIFSYIVLFGAGMLVIIMIGLPVLNLVKPDVIPSIAVLSGVGFYQFILNYRNCYASYFSCSNRIIYARSYVFASLLCILLASILLYAQWGVGGMIAAQIFSQIVYNAWHWPILAHGEMGLSIVEMIHLGFLESKKILVNSKRIKRMKD